MQLSIIIPAHNERNRIPPMLDAYIEYFNPRYRDEVEYIVVVNGSVDGTEHLIEDYIRRHHQVKLVVIPERIGKGGALVRGLHEATGELMGFADADGATGPVMFHELIKGIGNAGANIASRRIPGAEAGSPQTRRRRLASACFNLMVRTLFGLNIRDTQCGAKLMRREVIREVLPRVSSYHWTFDVDLLFQIVRAGYRVVETPARWKHIGGSHIHIVSSSLEMALSLIRLRLYYSPFRFVIRWFDRLAGRAIWRRRIMRGRMIYRRQLERANPDNPAAD